MSRPEPDFAALRARMVAEQLERRGISDPRVLEAMGKVPREAFTELAREPRTALALILLVLLGVVAIHVAMAKVPAESFFASLKSYCEPPTGASPTGLSRSGVTSSHCAAVNSSSHSSIFRPTDR